MRLSENNKNRLYGAISEPIMQQRINLKMTVNKIKTETVKAEEVDAMLFKLERKIWREVAEVLKVK